MSNCSFSEHPTYFVNFCSLFLEILFDILHSMIIYNFQQKEKQHYSELQKVLRFPKTLGTYLQLLCHIFMGWGRVDLSYTEYNKHFQNVLYKSDTMPGNYFPPKSLDLPRNPLLTYKYLHLIWR